MDSWRHIEELARPTVPPGPSDVLDVALASAARGADALDALLRWEDAGGGLPALESLDIASDQSGRCSRWADPRSKWRQTDVASQPSRVWVIV